MEFEKEANYGNNWQKRDSLELKAKKKIELRDKLLVKMNAGELIALFEFEIN